MSDRKYRQRGYQDDDQSKRHPRDEQQQGASKDRTPREFRKANFPGFREVSRCMRCSQVIDSAVDNTQLCTKCGSSLHSCGQCTWFDTGARFECSQPIPERISPKDGQNDCTYFELQRTVERETGSVGPQNAKTAFDDLFK